MFTKYKAATVVFVHKTHGIFLGLEIDSKSQNQWKPFGGKKELYDENSLSTVHRELCEETEGQLRLVTPFLCYYDLKSTTKMVLYVKWCSEELVYILNNLKKTSVKIKYQWFPFGTLKKEPYVPDYIKKLLELDVVPVAIN